MNQSVHKESATRTFGTLPVSALLDRALVSMRYHQPTPIQEKTIPVLREGRDVLAQAQTGTGKTAGFGIPLIESVNIQRPDVQAMVLTPTRELCLQVADELQRLGAPSGVRVVAVYGGVGFGSQLSGLRHGAHVVVGTPGRVEDLIQRGNLQLGRVRFAVLDEADRMLDVGFFPAVERIFKRMPVERQTSLFSATIPEEVRGLAQRQMRNPVTVEVDPERPTVDEIDQRFERVTDGDKLRALRTHLDNPACYLALVFRRTTYKADRLARDLARQGYKVAALHGRRTQSQRERVLADLKAGKLQALIATDIAARGLDIVGLTHVFNYDLPDTPETYIHRIGRTGRAGESGTAITLIAPEDEPAFLKIQRFLSGQRQERSGGMKSAPRPQVSRSEGTRRPHLSSAPKHSPLRTPREGGAHVSPLPQSRSHGRGEEGRQPRAERPNG